MVKEKEKYESDDIDDYFSSYINSKPIFKNKKFLQSNYIPNEVIHRKDEIKHMARILAPSLRGERPSNLFIYGKTGTGKTLTAQHVIKKMYKAYEISGNKDFYLNILYVNCKLKRVADTEYRLIAHLARNLGKDIPPTGLPTDEVYNIFTSAIEEKQQIVIIVLDEIDQLVKKTGDEIIYSLTRMNIDLKKSQISLVGISNDLLFTDYLDPRVKSSLSEEELMFNPYNALQIQEILRKRVEGAFSDNILKEGVIEKCAAYAAREHGDARRALELLRVSGELAERDEKENLEIKYVDEAETKIERDRIFDIISSQPRQFQAVLYAIIDVSLSKKDNILTGEVYNKYKNVCNNAGIRPLTQRRISDVLTELDMLGIINAKVTSKGRYGRTREVTLLLPSQSQSKVVKVLKDNLF